MEMTENKIVYRKAHQKVQRRVNVTCQKQLSLQKPVCKVAPQLASVHFDFRIVFIILSLRTANCINYRNSKVYTEQPISFWETRILVCVQAGVYVGTKSPMSFPHGQHFTHVVTTYCRTPLEKDSWNPVFVFLQTPANVFHLY